MAEIVICLLVAIATTLGAAGLLSILPRTVVNILGTVVDIFGAVAGILGAVVDILGVFTDIL